MTFLGPGGELADAVEDGVNQVVDGDGVSGSAGVGDNSPGMGAQIDTDPSDGSHDVSIDGSSGLASAIFRAVARKPLELTWPRMGSLRRDRPLTLTRRRT